MKKANRDALFVRLRDEVDAFIGVEVSDGSNKFDRNAEGTLIYTPTEPEDRGMRGGNERFDELFELYGEIFAEYVGSKLRSPSDIDYFGDCTMKHQMFDWLDRLIRKYPARPVRMYDNDMSSLVSAYIVEYLVSGVKAKDVSFADWRTSEWSDEGWAK